MSRLALPSLVPLHRLDEIVDPETVYVARPWSAPNPWLPSDPNNQDPPTGNMLPTGGSITCLAHRAVTGPDSLALYEMARLGDIAPHIGYSDQEEYGEALVRLGKERRSVLCDHMPPVEYRNGVIWHNALPLIAHLNDKRHLAELVPSSACPSRSFVPLDELNKLGESLSVPIVLKASTELGSGAGLDVRICRTDDELREAVAFFRGEAAFLNGIVLERFERFKATWCAVIAIRDDGWSYWGNAQQICTDEGRYGGNWKGTMFAMPERALDTIGHVAEQGMRRGFRGLAGMDLGETEDGRILVFDLNFRVNGCTSQVLLHDAACERIGADVSRLCRFKFSRPLAEAIAEVRPVVEDGTLVPIASFDSALDPTGTGVTSILSLVMGATQDDVCRLKMQLEALK